MNGEGIQLRVSDLLYAIKKRWLLILSLTVAGLLVGIVLSGVSYMKGEMSKEYVVTGSIAVTAQTGSGQYSSGRDYPNRDDLYVAQNVVDAAIYVLKSDKMLDTTLQRLSLLGVTSKDISANLELTQYNETQIIEMSLYWRSAQEGIAILQAINSIASDILMDTLKVGGVVVINEPSARYLIGGNINASLWGYMAVFGLMLGVGIAVLELLMRPTLLNTRDLEVQCGLEVLGEVPEDKAFFESNRASMLIQQDISSALTESFASIAHIVRNRIGTNEAHSCVYITSASRNEGKTTAAAQLALKLSDMEQRVLLIDFDMRNPTLGNLFQRKVDYSHSLNALYRGDITEEEAITTLTGYLDLLPTVLERNAIPLDSSVFDLVKRLSQRYDYVIMDTAPVGLVANTMSLNQIATHALFVVRYDTASMQEIRDALERMDKSGVRLLGCIVNGIGSAGTSTYKSSQVEHDGESSEAEDDMLNLTRQDNANEPEAEESGAETLAYNATSDDFVEQLLRVESEQQDVLEDVQEESWYDANEELWEGVQIDAQTADQTTEQAIEVTNEVTDEEPDDANDEADDKAADGETNEATSVATDGMTVEQAIEDADDAMDDAWDDDGDEESFSRFGHGESQSADGEDAENHPLGDD